MNPSVKDAMRDLVEALPEQCSWDDVMDRVYIRRKIQAGLDDESADRLVDHDEVFAEYPIDSNPVDRPRPA